MAEQMLVTGSGSCRGGSVMVRNCRTERALASERSFTSFFAQRRIQIQRSNLPRGGSSRTASSTSSLQTRPARRRWLVTADRQTGKPVRAAMPIGDASSRAAEHRGSPVRQFASAPRVRFVTASSGNRGSQLQQGRGTVPSVAHNHEVAGSTPAPATTDERAHSVRRQTESLVLGGWLVRSGAAFSTGHAPAKESPLGARRGRTRRKDPSPTPGRKYPGTRGARNPLARSLWGSSAVERATVNRVVAGSIPALTAANDGADHVRVQSQRGTRRPIHPGVTPVPSPKHGTEAALSGLAIARPLGSSAHGNEARSGARGETGILRARPSFDGANKVAADRVGGARSPVTNRANASRQRQRKRPGHRGLIRRRIASPDGIRRRHQFGATTVAASALSVAVLRGVVEAPRTPTVPRLPESQNPATRVSEAATEGSRIRGQYPAGPPLPVLNRKCPRTSGFRPGVRFLPEHKLGL